MEKPNVTKTRKLDLCVSCEICLATCPEDAITMEYKIGQILPKVDDEKCTNCGLCLEICPGIDIDPFELRHEKISDKTFDGPCLESYTTYSNDHEIRKNSASGGLITNLITELIKNKDFDAAFVLDFDKLDGKPARLKATNKINEILKAAKSKYIPASVYNVIKTLENGDNRKYIIVGTPCQIYGIKKFINNLDISEENYLFLGLFCDKTLNFNIIRYFEDVYRNPNEKLIKFEYRTKEKYGWPGNSKIYFNSGRELIIDKGVRMQLKPFFQLKKCLFCLDKLNRLADISFGDCYVERKGGFNGKSSVIIRTKKGKEVFGKYSHLFSLEREDIEKIRKSQHLMDKKDNLEYVRGFVRENNIYPNTISDYEINSHAVRRLSKLQRYIRWGKNYNINKIRCSLFLSKIATKLRTAGKIMIVGIIIGEGLFIYWHGRRGSISRKITTGNVIIVGGELFNKGAQAMTFTVVDQIKRSFPDKNIYLFSTQDFSRTDEEKGIYNFIILPYDLGTKIRLLSPLGKLFNSEYKYLEARIKEVIKNTDFFVDISGYALSSQWGWFPSLNYLLKIIIAKKYSIQYYIFPQSIGPFDYPLKYEILLYPLMKLYLKYPKRIFPREKEGLICVHKFTKKNVEKDYDIVLQSKGYNLANIYTREVRFKDIKIESNSVGIIPNLRVIERAKPDEIYSVYNSLINRLIDAEKRVYILRHSYEDLEGCEKIKNCFPDTKSVRLIPDDLNAIELENIIKQFDFIIASRYHSIVHSYKNGVPALVIGWATKYFELLKNFDQLDYFFDVRNKIDRDEINSKLNKLIKNWGYEKEKITDKMNSLSRENIFNIFD
jgi:coenzyme F420-reducing hydrogenase beta subunit